MAIPRVFVSSTCYDLKYIRENLRFFIKTIGYDPILSEDGSVFFNPKMHTHQACLAEVPNCQIFILVIGGRYGSLIKKGSTSITNAEYMEAVKLKIPIFTLVEQAVYSDHYVYTNNRHNKEVDITKIIYPSVDNIKIFDFIDQVRLNTIDNAIVPFKDFSDIESYLRQQWAGMMFSFLMYQNEKERIADTLTVVSSMNERIEMLSRQILKSVGTVDAKMTAALYDKMMTHESVRDISYFNICVTPLAILKNPTFMDCLQFLGKKITVEDKKNEVSISVDWISKRKLEQDETDYQYVRKELLDVLSEFNITLEEFIKSHKN